MTVAEVTQVYRKNNKIYGYRLRTANGVERDFEPDRLKYEIKNNQIVLSNYKLTSDNRLVKSENIFSDSNDNIYYLMNKNKIVAKADLFMNAIQQTDKLPYDFTTINEWIQLRARFSCAKDAKQFFEAIGIKTPEQFIDVTHCISLHDTFWIKKSTDKLNWKSVSPYTHNYSKIISTYALDGILIKDKNKNKNYFSPDMGTNGSYPHTWKFNDGKIVFIKAGSKYTIGGINSGREPFSEYFASIIARNIGFNCVDYRIRNHKRHDNRIDIVTECDCFTSEKTGSVTANLLGLNSYEEIISYCRKLSSKAYDDIINMLFLDCLLLNTDRHFSNIEFLVNNETLEILGLAPIFDNNFSLLPRFMEGLDKFDRSEYKVRDDRTFDELYELVKKHKNFRAELIKLKSFKLNKPQNVEMTDERINFINWLLQTQAEYLLKS